MIAVSADGTLVRWSRSGGAVPYYRVLETAVTAITVDGTGRKVLAQPADGSLWLYDMTSGPAAEFAAPASAAAPRPSPPPLHRGGNVLSQTDLPRPDPSRTLPPRPWRVCLRGRLLAAAKWTTTYVSPFYRPQTLSPRVWGSLLVFAHKTDLVEKPGKPVDPTEQVEAIARAHFGNLPVRKAEEDARSGVFRGARLRITADLPGLRCEPASAEFDWREPVHHVVFRLLAGT